MEKIFYTKRLQAYIQAEEPGFMGGPDFVRGLNPTQYFVLDHLGKPPIKKGELKLWARDIKEPSVNGKVFCKLSGLVTEADPSRRLLPLS